MARLLESSRDSVRTFLVCNGEQTADCTSLIHVFYILHVKARHPVAAHSTLVGILIRPLFRSSSGMPYRSPTALLSVLPSFLIPCSAE